MASDESPTPSGAPTGGATAEEAIYLGGGGGKERKEEEKEEVEYAETEQSEKLRLTAEKLTLQVGEGSATYVRGCSVTLQGTHRGYWHVYP